MRPSGNEEQDPRVPPQAVAGRNGHVPSRLPSHKSAHGGTLGATASRSECAGRRKKTDITGDDHSRLDGTCQRSWQSHPTRVPTVHDENHGGASKDKRQCNKGSEESRFQVAATATGSARRAQDSLPATKDDEIAQ